MKTVLTILVTGVVLMATPILASAHGNHLHNQCDSYRGWTSQSHSYSGHVQNSNRRPAHCNQRHLKREKRQLQRELRATRKELRHVKHRIRQQQQRPYYVFQPHYINPPVIFGIPQLVFQFGW